MAARLGDELYAVPLMPWCFGAMRRDVFDATEGFDPGLIQWGSTDNEISVQLRSLGYELKVPDVEVAHLFRDARPYPLESTPVLHNALRLAFVHFEADRIARVVGALRHHPDFPAAVALWTRPRMGPYPQVARYLGTGSTDEAENFTCRLP